MTTDYLQPYFPFNAAGGLNKINNMKEKTTYLKHNWKTSWITGIWREINIRTKRVHKFHNAYSVIKKLGNKGKLRTDAIILLQLRPYTAVRMHCYLRGFWLNRVAKFWTISQPVHGSSTSAIFSSKHAALVAVFCWQ